MIDGLKIKKTRKELGLSQSDLAKNITTQGTISLLERNSTSPGSTILVKLLNRLNLKLNDVIINDENVKNEQILDQADKLSMNYKHNDVLKLLEQIKEPKIKEQLTHYQFLKTDAKMWETRNYDDAIFGFNQLLLLHNEDIDSYTILATCELGVAYGQKKDTDKSNFYFDQTVTLFNQFDINKNVFWSLLIIDNLAMYFSNNNNSKKCLEFINIGLKLAKKYGVANFVDSFFYLNGEVLEERGDHEDAIKKMLCAWSFSKFLENNIIEEKSISFLEKRGIKIKF